jgi:D-amino-acid dehydrogenase
MPHIAVIGAGITGVTTAYALLKRGYQVTIIDRHRYPAMETSYANGGQLSASNAEVWTSWSTVRKGLKWIFKNDAPLLLNPSLSWHKYSWLGEFVASIPKYSENTIKTTQLAIAAREHMFSIAENEGIEFDLVKRGILHVYRDRGSFENASAVNRLLVKGGLDRRPITAEEISSIEPTLKGDFYGGFYTPSDFTGDIYKFSRGLAEVCGRMGARFIFETKVTKIQCAGQVTLSLSKKNGSTFESMTVNAEKLVVCAGVGSRALATMAGDRINVYPVKGYSITVHLDDAASEEAAPWVSLLDEETKIVSSRLGKDRLRVAGTAEFNGVNHDIRYDRVKPLEDWVEQLFPGLPTTRVVPWAGLRPMTPDMMPRVHRGKNPRVYYNTGHGHLGWTLSCVTADMVSNLIDTDCAQNNSAPQ